MSRTNKTLPPRIQRARGLSWREVRFNNGSAMKFGRKEFWGSRRTAERNALRAGETPESVRTRHSVRWDLF